MTAISPSRRLRRTVFSAGVEQAGVKGYTVYNHMLLPTVFSSVVEDYHHLKRHVQLWDVSCERQISIAGPDAKKLMTLLSPRDLSRMADDQCFYIPVICREGGMLNDPVAIKLADDHYWVSIADSDFLQYVLGVADALQLQVRIEEPDVSPLGIQGPKADALLEKLFGPAIRDIRFFRYRKLAFEGHEMIVARSGFSKQGGFEIYVEGSAYAMPLWQALMQAGEALEVRAGCPNLIERIEGGLLSYGNDMTRANTPYEAGLGRFVNATADYIGKAGLAGRPAGKMVRPIAIEGEVPVCDRLWPVYAEGRQVGAVSSAAFSPDFEISVAIGMICKSHWDAGTRLEVESQDAMHRAQVAEGFWS